MVCDRESHQQENREAEDNRIKVLLQHLGKWEPLVQRGFDCHGVETIAGTTVVSPGVETIADAAVVCPGVETEAGAAVFSIGVGSI